MPQDENDHPDGNQRGYDDNHLFQVSQILLDLRAVLGQLGIVAGRPNFGNRTGLAVAAHKPPDQRQARREQRDTVSSQP